MGPGPSDISPQVPSFESSNHRSSEPTLFIAMMDEVKQLLKYHFRQIMSLRLLYQRRAAPVWKLVFVNLIEPGEKVIVCRNGVFGERMRENVVRCGGEAILVDDEWGKPVSVEKFYSKHYRKTQMLSRLRLCMLRPLLVLYRMLKLSLRLPDSSMHWRLLMLWPH